MRSSSFPNRRDDSWTSSMAWQQWQHQQLQQHSWNGRQPPHHVRRVQSQVGRTSITVHENVTGPPELPLPPQEEALFRHFQKRSMSTISASSLPSTRRRVGRRADKKEEGIEAPPSFVPFDCVGTSGHLRRGDDGDNNNDDGDNDSHTTPSSLTAPSGSSLMLLRRVWSQEDQEEKEEHEATGGGGADAADANVGQEVQSPRRNYQNLIAMPKNTRTMHPSLVEEDEATASGGVHRSSSLPPPLRELMAEAGFDLGWLVQEEEQEQGEDGLVLLKQCSGDVQHERLGGTHTATGTIAARQPRRHVSRLDRTLRIAMDDVLRLDLEVVGAGVGMGGHSQRKNQRPADQYGDQHEYRYQTSLNDNSNDDNQARWLVPQKQRQQQHASTPATHNRKTLVLLQPEQQQQSGTAGERRQSKQSDYVSLGSATSSSESTSWSASAAGASACGDPTIMFPIEDCAQFDPTSLLPPLPPAHPRPVPTGGPSRRPTRSSTLRNEHVFDESHHRDDEHNDGDRANVSVTFRHDATTGSSVLASSSNHDDDDEEKYWTRQSLKEEDDRSTVQPPRRLDSVLSYQTMVSEITMPPSMQHVLKLDQRAPQYQMALEQQHVDLDKGEMTIRTTNQRSLGGSLSRSRDDSLYYDNTSSSGTTTSGDANVNVAVLSTGAALVPPSRRRSNETESITPLKDNTTSSTAAVIPRVPRRKASPPPIAISSSVAFDNKANGRPSATLSMTSRKSPTGAPPSSSVQMSPPTRPKRVSTLTYPSFCVGNVSNSTAGARASSGSSISLRPITSSGSRDEYEDDASDIADDDSDDVTPPKPLATRHLTARDSVRTEVVDDEPPVLARKGTIGRDSFCQKPPHRPSRSIADSTQLQSIEVWSTQGSMSSFVRDPQFTDSIVTTTTDETSFSKPVSVMGPFVSPTRVITKRFLPSAKTPQKESNPLLYPQGLPFAPPDAPLSDGPSLHNSIARRPAPCGNEVTPSTAGPAAPMRMESKEIDLSVHSRDLQILDISKSDQSLIFEPKALETNRSLDGSYASFHEDIDLSQHDFDVGSLDMSHRESVEQVVTNLSQRNEQHPRPASAPREIDLSDHDPDLQPLDISNTTPAQVLHQQAGQETTEEEEHDVDVNCGDNDDTERCYEEDLNDVAVPVTYEYIAKGSISDTMSDWKSEDAIAGDSAVTANGSMPDMASFTASTPSSTTRSGRINRTVDEHAIAIDSSSAPESMVSSSNNTDSGSSFTTATTVSLPRVKNCPMEVKFLVDLQADEWGVFTGLYSGPLNSKGQMHGNGVFWFDSGDLYLGQFDCGNLHGCGALSILVEDVVDVETNEVLSWKTHILKGSFRWNTYVGTGPEEDGMPATGNA